MTGELPLHVTHNDTKLNNVMLDAETRTAMCVIGLGWRIGKIAPGYTADFLLLTEALTLSAVYIDGRKVI